MISYRFTRAMVKAAILKGIHDIHDNPGRGARNLAELGDRFSRGPSQKFFFQSAVCELQKKNSLYYKLIERIVKQTDPNILLNFGINLGFNSLVYGSAVIRRLERERGHSIPYTALFHLGRDGFLRQADLLSFIRQGKELGIFHYLLCADRSYPDMDGVLEVPEREKDCAFGLLLHPDAVNGPLGKRIRKAGNVLVNLDLDGGADIERAAALLRENRCLFGCSTGYEDLQAIHNPVQLMRLSARLGCGFLCFVRKKSRLPAANEIDLITRWRENLPAPILPMDLYADLLSVCRKISPRSCPAAVLEDGSFALIGSDYRTLNTGYNIRSSPLEEILRQTLIIPDPAD